MPVPHPSGGAQKRNLIAFWILGLTNNYAYVIMLSAAHDILAKEDPNNSTLFYPAMNWTYPITDELNSGNNSGKLVPNCNPIGTGAILLADILPTLIIKFTAPFFMHLIPYSLRVAMVIIFAAASFVTVSLSHFTWLSILGVVMASCSSGIGEITFLSLSSYFDKNVVSTWSSGTGGAGIFGALSYAGLTAAGVHPRDSLLIMLAVPAIMMLTYYKLLVKPANFATLNISVPGVNEEDNEEEQDNESKQLLLTNRNPKVKFDLKRDLLLIIPLLKYMVPLSLVYLAEYFINQALFELVYFPDIWLAEDQQYRWYQVIYQMGVFISRSSVNLFQVQHLWILPILQFANVALLLCQIFFSFIPFIWIIFIIILYEGLLGGLAYVNTFYRISQEISNDNLEFSLGVATMGDSLGITIAGIIAVPVHNKICSLPA